MLLTIDWKQTGLKIRGFMKQEGYSIKQLANTLFLNESTIKNYLYSETPIPTETLCHMAKLFGMEKSEDLLAFSNNSTISL